MILIISIFCYVCSSTCHCKECKANQAAIFSEPKKSDTKFIGKQSYFGRSIYYYMIDGFNVYEERLYQIEDYSYSVAVRFTLNRKKDDDLFEKIKNGEKIPEENSYLPINVETQEQFNGLLSEKCVFCKYKNNILEKIVPIMTFQDMFEYTEFFFLMEDPLLIKEYENNFKHFKEGLSPNYENLSKNYTLSHPIIICKACFLNKLNEKQGITKLFSVFEKKKKCGLNDGYFGGLTQIENDHTITVIYGSCGDQTDAKGEKKNSNMRLLTEANMQMTKKPKSKEPVVEENFLQQLSRIDLSISSKIKFKYTADGKSDRKESSSQTCNDKIEEIKDEEAERSELSNKLISFQENIDSIIKYLNLKMQNLNEDDSYKNREVWINHINSICEQLHINSDLFKMIIDSKAEYIVKIVKQIKVMLETIHKNLIYRSKLSKNYCFETMILFKDNMLIVRKINNIFEYMINKFKSNSDDSLRETKSKPKIGDCQENIKEKECKHEDNTNTMTISEDANKSDS